MWEIVLGVSTTQVHQSMSNLAVHGYVIVISAVPCILYIIGSGRNCSYSSSGPPGGGCCTVCSHLAPVEVNFSLR